MAAGLPAAIPSSSIPTHTRSPMRIGLKDCAWERAGDGLVLICDPSRSIELDDPDGQVDRLLTALRDHPGTVAQLRDALAADGPPVDVDELTAALGALDELRILRDLDRVTDRE